MTVVPNKVLRWLWDAVTTKYQDPNRTYSDVARTLQLYPSLRPRTEVHTSSDGSSALLLCLNGTIPVPFRGATFNIPIVSWIPLAYPREAPMVYVTPTPEMAVRPGQHVSIEGMIYHPYLANWRSHSDRSTLADFLSILIQVFAKEPPVAARGQNQPPRPDQSRAGPSSSRPPPLPPTPHHLSQRNSTVPHGPTPPAKPSKLGQVDESVSARYSAPPPPPPPKPYENHPHERESYGNGSSGITQPSMSTPGPHQYARPNGPPLSPLPGSPGRWLQSQLPQQQGHDMYPPRQGNDPRMSQHTNQSQPYTVSPNTTYFQQPPQTLIQQPPLRPTIKKPTQDLLTSPLDVTIPSQANPHIPTQPVPQVPPNPEKDALLHALSTTLLTQLSTTIAQNQAALPALQAQQTALRQAEKNMQAELSQLHTLDATLTSNEKILHEAMREVDRVKESVGQRQPPAVDDVLVAPTVVGEQLYGLVADERSISDAMFLLSRALDRGRVAGDVFVKQTRSLAREQFMKKALIRKIAMGMGMVVDE